MKEITQTQQEAMCTQYTRQKYIEHVPNKPTWGKDKYANAENNNVVAMEFSRRREREPSASRTFVKAVSDKTLLLCETFITST